MGFDSATCMDDVLANLGILDEAALLVDDQGRLLFANDSARLLLGWAAYDISGADIHDVIFNHDLTRVSDDEFPLALNGQDVLAMACRLDGSMVPVACRGALLASSHVAVILLRDVRQADRALHDHVATLSDLRHENERIRGILSIMSTSTLAGAGFEDFMSEMTDRLEAVFEADAVLVYLVEGQGYRLRGASRGYEDLGVDQTFVGQGQGVTSLVSRLRRSVRLRRVAQAAGMPGTVMVDLDANQRVRLRTRLAASCETIIGTPVFSYDRVMAVVLTCWRSYQPVAPEEAGLLDDVASYLALEFSSAVSQFQQMRQIELQKLIDEVRETVRAEGEMSERFAEGIANRVTKLIPAHVIELIDNPWTSQVAARSLDELMLHGDPQLPGAQTAPKDDEQQLGAGVLLRNGAEDGGIGATESQSLALAIPERGIGLPLTFAEMFPGGEVCRRFEADDPLGEWLARHADLDNGLLIRLSSPNVAGEQPQRALMLLRGPYDPPFDDLELGFCRNLASVLARSLDDVREASAQSHISQALQHGLQNKLPQVPGLTSASLYLSATEAAVVGGDFFDLYALPDGCIAVLIGDISGKGVEAAAMAALVKTAVAAYAWDGLSPEGIASSVNNMVTNFSRVESFASMVLVIVDPKQRKARYCSAGHPPAMLVHDPFGDAPELELLTEQSPVIGAMEGLAYHQGSFAYAQDDLLFLYTDGTTEARSPEGGFFGEDQLREILLRACALDVETIPKVVLGKVANYSQGDLHDDIAMVALRFA